MHSKKLLVDTHYLIWDLMGHIRFSKQIEKTLKSNQGNCYISPISYWEVGMLLGKKRIELPVTVEQFFADLKKKRAYKELPITAAIGEITRKFSKIINGDPADRILVATAMSQDAVLLTKDTNLLSLSFLETLEL